MRASPTTLILATSLLATVHASASEFTVASYSTQGLSGSAPQWNGVGSFESAALPALRGSGLGLAGGFNQFAATSVSTSPTLSLANNDYVRFGFTLSQNAGAEVYVTEFRAVCGSFGIGSAGMHYQVWAYLTDQEPFLVSQPALLPTPGSSTQVLVTNFPSNAIVLPGQTAEFRVYFWGATGTQNGIAFISDGSAATPDVEIKALPVPTPMSTAFLMTCGVHVLMRRRRLIQLG